MTTMEHNNSTSSRLHLMRTKNSVDGFVRISRFTVDECTENRWAGYGRPVTKLMERNDIRPLHRAMIPLAPIKIQKIRNNATRRANSHDGSLPNKAIHLATGVGSSLDYLNRLRDPISDALENQEASSAKGIENRPPRLSVPPWSDAKSVLTKTTSTFSSPPSPLNYRRSILMPTRHREPRMEQESIPSSSTSKSNRQPSASQRVTGLIATQVRKLSNSTLRKLGVPSPELAEAELKGSDSMASAVSPTFGSPLRRVVSPNTLFENLATYITRYDLKTQYAIAILAKSVSLCNI
jgi:hypothetical protein